MFNVFGERGLRTCALDEKLIANGHLIPAKGTDPNVVLLPDSYALHINWTSDLSDKIDRLRVNGLWFLD